MNYKITTLAENSVYGKGLQEEHGLSLLVEVGKHKVLFDIGAPDLFIQNARLVGADLTDMKFVTLFHGYHDHTSGLHTFLKMDSRAKVVYKQEVFRRRFKNGRENGILHPKALDKSRFRLIDETTEIVPGVSAFPDVRIVDRNDTHFKYFSMEIGNGMYPNTLEDELTLILKSERSLSVLSVCSHRGITNIIRAMQTAFPGLGLGLVMGGFHIHNTGIEKLNVASAFLDMKLPKRLGVYHCTGIDKYALFRQQFNDRVLYDYTGWVETI